MLVYVILCVIFFIIENEKWLLVHLLGEQDESAHLQFGIVSILRFQCFVNQHFLTVCFVCLFSGGRSCKWLLIFMFFGASLKRL